MPCGLLRGVWMFSFTKVVTLGPDSSVGRLVQAMQAAPTAALLCTSGCAFQVSLPIDHPLLVWVCVTELP